jgi:phospholipid transport system substrate-binding protein
MINRRQLTILGILALATVPILGSGPAHAVEPAEFIRNVGQEAIASLTGHDVSQAEREKRFRRILERAFDMRAIARFTLGRYWRIASKKERQEYVELFEAFVVQSYAVRFKGYNGESFEVGEVREVGRKDKLVVSEIGQHKGPPIHINWRVRGNNGYRIVDVVVEGISMGITQRDEFASVIRNHGGKVEGLLAALRKKTGRD